MKINQLKDDEKSRRIALLLAGYLTETLRPEEHDELNEWVNASDENLLLFEELTDENNVQTALKELQRIQADSAYETIAKRIPFQPAKRARVIWPYAVAASVLLVLASLWFFRGRTEHPQPILAVQETRDLPPGTDRAILTLSDGRRLVLEPARLGDEISEPGSRILLADSGKLQYRAGGPGGEAAFNRLEVPRGGRYQLVLADGTRVWLNAETTLRYPVAFPGTERVVELTGEAYFEVAHDPGRPFYVRSQGQQIRVLGTKFNVSAYPDNPFIATTLLEGSIALSSGSSRAVLKPGQQFRRTPDGRLEEQVGADLRSATAWKEGRFRFRNERMEPILRELVRWYDAEVVYEDSIRYHFNGEISRNLPVSRVLKLLENTGVVRFEVRGQKIIVKKPG